MIFRWLSLLAIPSLGFSLEMQPWLSNIYEFHFMGYYAYSQFHSVEGSRPHWDRTFHANQLYAGLEFSPKDQWCIDSDAQVASTTQGSFYFLSCALQGRYLWLDEMIGDGVTFTTGANMRVNSSDALHDVSSPSFANVDFELNFALGREWDITECSRMRLWCHGALGQAIKGSPWLSGRIAIENNISDEHKWALFANALSSYGSKTHIDVDHFDGYAHIRKRTVDVGVNYGHSISVYGTWRIEMTHRFLAKAAPQSVNTVQLSYSASFSF